MFVHKDKPEEYLKFLSGLYTVCFVNFLFCFEIYEIVCVYGSIITHDVLQK